MTAPVDPEIRKLAADPDIRLVIAAIDAAFEGLLVDGETARPMIENSWRLIKRGVLILIDHSDIIYGDDPDPPLIREAKTPFEQARARVIGSKLFAVRNYLRRTARRYYRH